MNKLITNEVVFRGHPDKVADQISDGLLDLFLSKDKMSRVAIEVLASNNSIFIGGEVNSREKMYQREMREKIKEVYKDIGYSPEGVEIIIDINKQSPDISQGVDNEGAGDNGIMYGYACDGYNYIPQAQYILQEFSYKYDQFRKVMPGHFLPDGKAQLTGLYDENNRLISIKEIIICYQNPEEDREFTDDILKRTMLQVIKESEELYANILNYNHNIKFNPTGRFEVGGIVGDAGLTGRKLLIDNYHAFSKVGGGAYSGKDPTKVDRSGAYYCRQLAINKLREYELSECWVQASYAIGLKEPRSIYIKGLKDGKLITIEPKDEDYKNGEPEKIIETFNLRRPIYEKTAQFGHYGHNFPWEK